MKKIFAGMLLLVVLSVPVYSQELSELKVADKGKIAPGELIDKNIRDANGEVCAGLMIISDLDGFTYSSYDHVVKVNRMPGKDLLFLSPEERVVEVYRTGFKPLKIILNEFGIKLGSGRVWQMAVSGKRADSISINIIPNVPDVKIFIDSLDRGTNNTQLVTVGKHELKLVKGGYKTLLDTIDASPSNILFNYKLEEIDLIPVQVASIPPGAKIFINNLDQGETDKGVFLMPGGYTLKLIKPGYKEVDDSITVTEKPGLQFTYELKMTAGILDLEVEPKDANVLINKNDYTSKNEIVLNPGTYKLEIRKQGYYPVSELINIRLHSPVKRSYKLVERKGGLRLTVQPLLADIKLTRNGEVKYNWQGMKILKDIQEGEYNLECSLNGYKTINKTVVIEEGKTLREEIRLEKETLITKEESKAPEEDGNSQEVSDAEKDYGISKNKGTDSNQPSKKRRDLNPPSSTDSPADNHPVRTYSSKSGFSIQLGASYGFNFSSVAGSDISDITKSSPDRGAAFGAILDINFTDAFGLITTMQFKDSRTISISEGYYVGSHLNGEYQTIETNLNVEYLTVEPLLKLCVPGIGLYFVAGPSVSIEAKGTYESRIIASKIHNTFPNGSDIQSGDLQDLNENYALKAGIGLDIDLGRTYLTPQVTYGYSFNEISPNSSKKITTIQAVIALKLKIF